MKRTRGPSIEPVLRPPKEEIRNRPPEKAPQPDATVIAQRPRPEPSVGTCFATDENLDAHVAWMAHITAGRIRPG